MTDSQQPPPETLIVFPCQFPIKVMGETNDQFAPMIAAAIQQLAPQFNANHISARGSAEGKYTSLTCTVYVESKSQLDAIYTMLSQHPMVKVVL